MIASKQKEESTTLNSTKIYVDQRKDLATHEQVTGKFMQIIIHTKTKL
jgi:hypothetical protein